MPVAFAVEMILYARIGDSGDSDADGYNEVIGFDFQGRPE